MSTAVDNSPEEAREAAALVEEIGRLKQERDALIMAHYYQRDEIQQVADLIGDSLALARQAARTDKKVIVMCGVNFMGETAKLLCPDKTVLLPAPEAGCSLADRCPADEFAAFVAAHPGHTVISYVNTTAAVKALSDIIVTSGNAVEIVESLPADEKIIFGPDRNLGSYINEKTGRQMTVWQGACHLHQRFSLEKILELKKQHPDARVLVHPECPAPVRLIADRIGSTKALLDYAITLPAGTEMIIATESGILSEMRRACPDKVFIAAPADDSTCGCNDCSYMKLITLRRLRDSLRDMSGRVEVDPSLAERARRPIERMLEISDNLKIK